MALRDIALGRYVYGESFLHRLDPRTKLIGMLVFMTALFAGQSWLSLGIAALFTFTAAAVSGLGAGYILRSLSPFKWLILFTFLLNVLFVGGHIIVRAPLPYGGITAEGLADGGRYAGRIALLVFTASLMTLTTQPVSLVAGVERLLAPFRRFGIKPHDIAVAMVITIRFIPVLLDEAEKVRKSLIARGLRPEKGIAVRLRATAHLLMPLVLSAVKRAEELAVAMECRLYRGAEQRTRYFEITMAPRDWAALLLTGIAAVAVAMV